MCCFSWKSVFQGPAQFLCATRSKIPGTRLSIGWKVRTPGSHCWLWHGCIGLPWPAALYLHGWVSHWLFTHNVACLQGTTQYYAKGPWASCGCTHSCTRTYKEWRELCRYLSQHCMLWSQGQHCRNVPTLMALPLGRADQPGWRPMLMYLNSFRYHSSLTFHCTVLLGAMSSDRRSMAMTC